MLGEGTGADATGGATLTRPLKLLFIGLEEAVPIFGATGDSGTTSFNGPGVGTIPGDQLETAGWLFKLKASVFSGVGPDKFLL